MFRIKRQKDYATHKAEKAKAKSENRKKRQREEEELGEKAPPKKVQRTLDNTREKDDTIVQPDDEEVLEDEGTDVYAPYFRGEYTPEVLITTNRKPTGNAFKFIKELLSVIPNSKYHRRHKFDIKKIVEFVKNSTTYTDIVIVNEYKREPNALTIIHLPDGPTAHFKLSNVRYRDQIPNKGKPSNHLPEIILNNFNTRLGHSVGRMLAALFPPVAQFKGRQAVTFHNQRDFIFFRRHRYIFRDGKRVDLQELGPKFTLKLQWLQKGTFDTKYGDYEWHHKRELDTSRRRFFL